MKRVVNISVILLTVLTSGFLTSCKSAPNFREVAKRPPKGFTVKALPVFMIPEVDIKNGNDIVSVFIYREDSKTLSVTVVFQDEDHPSWITDRLYDIYRRFKYKRKMDVETFKLLFADKSDMISALPVSISFPGTYSESQVFFTRNVKHYSKTVTLDRFTMIGERPVIYVNTWNHLFSEKNNNLDLKLVTRKDYPVYWGSRQDVEALY